MRVPLCSSWDLSCSLGEYAAEEVQTHYEELELIPPVPRALRLIAFWIASVAAYGNRRLRVGLCEAKLMICVIVFRKSQCALARRLAMLISVEQGRVQVAMRLCAWTQTYPRCCFLAVLFGQSCLVEEILTLWVDV